MRLSHLLIPILIIGLTSCNDTKPVTSITVQHSKDKTLIISNVSNQIYDTVETTADATTSHQIDIDAPTVININDGSRGYDFYISPGDQLTVKNDPEARDAIRVQAEEGTTAEIYSRLSKTIGQARSLVNVYKAPDTASLQDSLDKKYASAADIISSVKNTEGTSASFVSILEDRLAFARANDMENFESGNEYYLKKKPELPEDYYDFRKALDVNGENIVLTGEGRAYASNYIDAMNDADYDDGESKYFRNALKVVGTIFTNPTNKAYFESSQMQDILSFNGGLDNGNEELVMEAKKNTTNTYLLSKYDDMVSEWKHLKSGSEAPNFDGMNRADEKVQLSDLKGKYVYVDVWATWCGPCLREIPDLKKVEKEYHDKDIEFVSISIDKQDDKEKWIKMVGDKDLKGTQIMADNAWQSDVVTEYNIAGIPRFMLIDKQGNLVQVNAPSPSNPVLTDLFDSLEI